MKRRRCLVCRKYVGPDRRVCPGRCHRRLKGRYSRPVEPIRATVFVGIDIQLEPGPSGTGAAAECMAEGSLY